MSKNRSKIFAIAVLVFAVALTSEAQWDQFSATNIWTSDTVGIGPSSFGSSIPLFVAANGLTLSGTGKYNFRVGSADASKGLLLGYDDSANVAIISTVGPGSVVAFWTHNGTDYGERARFDGSGNLLVGTTTGTAKLTVGGDVSVSGNIAAKYQDLAEWVPASSDLEPGTVVVLNPDANNEVMASSNAYDTTVAGVVSAQPGLLLGEKGDSKEMIATTGRVLVRVDATRRAIRVGDLLVTSGKLGTAMKSDPIEIGSAKVHRPGTIIGKALEPLASGEGKILVLLSLQ